jgi:flagellar protein FliJ
MKKFRFKLQTVLDQRQIKEDQYLAELAKARQQEAAEILKLEDLKTKLKQVCKSIENAFKDNLDISELERWNSYAEATRDDIKVQELTLKTVREIVEQKRQDLVEAMKEKQVLETLRDKQEQQYLKVAATAEQTILDEMASLKYLRSA